MKMLNDLGARGSFTGIITYKNAEEKMYIVNSSAPCNEKINIPANTTETAYFTITIDPETKGDVVVEVLTR